MPSDLIIVFNGPLLTLQYLSAGAGWLGLGWNRSKGQRVDSGSKAEKGNKIVGWAIETVRRFIQQVKTNRSGSVGRPHNNASFVITGHVSFHSWATIKYLVDQWFLKIISGRTFVTCFLCLGGRLRAMSSF